MFWVTVGTRSVDAQWNVHILHKMWYMSQVMCWVGCGCFVTLMLNILFDAAFDVVQLLV
jgi:hypothetical protein